MYVRATVTTKWDKRGYRPVDVTNIMSYSVDSSMDTDTDSWTIQFGDIERELVDVLRRDNEVRVSLYGFANGKTEALHTGYVDEITFDEQSIFTFSGRDMTAPAVDSQHPPAIWHSIRPEVLVAREARALKIGSRMKLAKAPGFKTYGTDGSESYWQVWYRFYRKRRMWMWAEPDGALIAGTLNYNQHISYYFGAYEGTQGQSNPHPDHWIPVETVEWRSNKQQRIGEVFYFGHRGDVGFVAHAVDPTMKQWVKKPLKIFTSGDVHNAAEARAEAWEEMFESKVGSVEVKLTVEDQGYIIRQGTMARVNIPQIGLKGDFYVVGVHIVGSVSEGFFQEVRLREKNYAISRRVPTDPALSTGPTSDKATSTLGKELGNGGGGSVRWANYFIEAAQKYRGPWPFDLFLGVLISICAQESNFYNAINGKPGVDYPDTPDGRVPSVLQQSAYAKFLEEFANEVSKGHTTRDKAVGPMQLLTLGYKLAADRMSDLKGVIGDEVFGGRWEPRWNIHTSAVALNSKLNGGFTVSPSGIISKTKVSGLSLQPTEANIWQGVADYGEGPTYAAEVRALYNETYKALVGDAQKASAADSKNIAASDISGSSKELQKRVLSNDKITFTRASQKSDISGGLIVDDVLRFMLAFTDAGFNIVVSALRSDHSTNTTEGRVSAHSVGKAVDMMNYNTSTIGAAREAMKWIGDNQKALGFSQLIGPDPKLVIPYGIYDKPTLDQHKSHIHVGYAL